MTKELENMLSKTPVYIREDTSAGKYISQGKNSSLLLNPLELQKFTDEVSSILKENLTLSCYNSYAYKMFYLKNDKLSISFFLINSPCRFDSYVFPVKFAEALVVFRKLEVMDSRSKLEYRHCRYNKFENKITFNLKCDEIISDFIRIAEKITGKNLSNELLELVNNNDKLSYHEKLEIMMRIKSG